jgi:hypothetical protein
MVKVMNIRIVIERELDLNVNYVRDLEFFKDNLMNVINVMVKENFILLKIKEVFQLIVKIVKVLDIYIKDQLSILLIIIFKLIFNLDLLVDLINQIKNLKKFLLLKIY